MTRIGRGTQSVLVGMLRKREHLEDLGVDGSIMFKLIFKEWDWGYGLD